MAENADFLAEIRAAQNGDPAARDALFDRFYPVVRRVVHRQLASDLRMSKPWIGAMFSTGDVVQEVFLSVLRELDDFDTRSEGAFVNYLVTLTKNRLIDAVRFHEADRRDRRRTTDLPNISPVHAESDPVGDAVSAEAINRFCRVLETFSSRDRLLLRERLEKRTTFAELASQLGYQTPNAARKAFHVAQARMLLRLRTEDDPA